MLEYKVVSFFVVGAKSLEIELNRHAAEGWRFHSASNNCLVFKRQKRGKLPPAKG